MRAIDSGEEYGLSCEVIDARSIVPFHYAPVVESVKKTGKLLLASDAVERGSILQTFANKISTLAFEYLDAPPVVVGARNWITPPDEVEDSFFPFPAGSARRDPRAPAAPPRLRDEPRQHPRGADPTQPGRGITGDGLL